VDTAISYLQNEYNTEATHVWHGLQQSAVDSAIDGGCIFSPAYGTKGDNLSYDNMVIEWAVVEAVKQCSRFVEYVFEIG